MGSLAQRRLNFFLFVSKFTVLVLVLVTLISVPKFSFLFCLEVAQKFMVRVSHTDSGVIRDKILRYLKLARNVHNKG